MDPKKDKSKVLIQKYFEDTSFVNSNIESFNNFIEKELQHIIDSNKVIEPTIIPSNVEEFKIKFDKIWVTKPEIQMIADYLKLPPGQLRQRYLRRIGLRTTIIEEPKNKDCIFLYQQDQSKRCRIYPMRPNQCRIWPFWASNLTNPRTWNEAAQKCPGINRGRLYPQKEIERLKKQRWYSEAGHCLMKL